MVVPGRALSQCVGSIDAAVPRSSVSDSGLPWSLPADDHELRSPVAADAAPPPIQAQYCYRTLASVDCYTEAKPDRATGYTGVYPDPNSVAAAAPYSAPARKPIIPPLVP